MARITKEQIEDGGVATKMKRMGRAFPDSNIDPDADISGNQRHTLMAIWYELNSSGALVKRDDSSYGTEYFYSSADALLTRQSCTDALVCVSNGTAAWMDTLCSSESNRATAISTLVTFCQDNQFQGVELDREGFGNWTATHRANFKIFCTELGDALHDEGYILQIDGPPIRNDATGSAPPAWATADSQGYYEFKYEELNDLPIDRVVVMAYDYQYDYSAGEPNQPLEWLRDILEWVTTKVNTSRITVVAGLPCAGYYGATGGYSITNSTYDFLSAQTGFDGASRDADSGEIIWANGGNSYALIDDEALRQKIAICAETGVTHYSVRHIGDNTYGGDKRTNIISEKPNLPVRDAKALRLRETVYHSEVVDNGNSGTSATIDWSLGNMQKITLTGNCTFTFTAPSGPCKLELELIQDGTGSRTITLPASVKRPGATAPTLSTGAGDIDIIAISYDGTNYRAVASLDFS